MNKAKEILKTIRADREAQIVVAILLLVPLIVGYVGSRNEVESAARSANNDIKATAIAHASIVQTAHPNDCDRYIDEFGGFCYADGSQYDQTSSCEDYLKMQGFGFCSDDGRLYYPAALTPER